MNRMKARFFFLIPFLFAFLFSPATFSADTLDLKNLTSVAVGVRFDYTSGIFYLLTKNDLISYRLETVEELGRFKFGAFERPLRLDLIDIDGDGRLNPVVTSVVAEGLRSYVFASESGKDIKVLAKNLPYFFRVSRIDGADVLLGQRSTEVEPFAGAIYVLSLSGGKIKRGERLELPKNIGIYSFASPTTDNGKIWIRDGDGYLKLYEKLEKKWKAVSRSSEKYKGGVNCISFTELVPMAERVREALCVPVPPVILRLEAGTRTPKNGEGKDIGKGDKADKGVGRWTSAQGQDSIPLGEMIFVDDHAYLLGGVILTPQAPHKSYLYALSTQVGLDECRKWGPFQGAIADYFVEVGLDKRLGLYNLVLLRNESGKNGGVRLTDIDITGLDCKGEM